MEANSIEHLESCDSSLSSANNDAAREVNAAPQLPPAGLQEDRLLPDHEIQRALGQSIQQALDLRGWDENRGLEKLLTRVHEYVAFSMREEGRLRELVRRHVLNELPRFPNAPDAAGVYPVPERLLRDARRNVLLNGQVTAVDGASVSHDSLAATLVSVGVSLVRYDGKLNTWRTSFLRHDYNLRAAAPLEEVRSALDHRSRRSEEGQGAGNRDHLSYLLRRGFMAAAERKTLLEKTQTRWRLGHGLPAPLELLTGSGSMALIDEMLPILEQLLLQHKRWVFVPSALSSLAYSTMANALDPGQVAIFQKGKASLDQMVETGHYDPKYKRRVQEFAGRLGEAIVIGGFRATRYAPGQLFVAHAEHALSAGVLALADAELQPHRGVPLLIDLAGLSAKVGLGMEAFQGVVESAYAKAGAGGMFTADRIINPMD